MTTIGSSPYRTDYCADQTRSPHKHHHKRTSNNGANPNDGASLQDEIGFFLQSLYRDICGSYSSDDDANDDADWLTSYDPENSWSPFDTTMFSDNSSVPASTSTTSSTGSNAATVATQYIGQNSGQLEANGTLPQMDSSVPDTVDCANFVSACLEKSGQIPDSAHSNSVSGLRDNLLNLGWHETSSADAKTALQGAKPGDPVAFDGPDGQYQHTVIFNGYDAQGNPLFVGSNNDNADGSQRIDQWTGTPSWVTGVHVFSKPQS